MVDVLILLIFIYLTFFSSKNNNKKEDEDQYDFIPVNYGRFNYSHIQKL